MSESDSEDVEDPFKSLSSITELDERMSMFVGSLGDFHSALAEIALSINVPIEIRQHFETAKNLSLYACFAYRFHQVAEFWGFSALEMALRERRLRDEPELRKTEKPTDVPMLKRLLKQATSEGWFNSISDELRWERAYHTVCNKKRFAAIEALKANPELDGVEWVEPTHREIAAAWDPSDPVTPIIDSAKSMRDNLAHGSTNLHPNSAATLRQTAQLINSLFT